VNSALLPSTKLAKLKIDSCSPLQSAWNYNRLKSKFKLSLFQIKLISVARRVVCPNPMNHPWIHHWMSKLKSINCFFGLCLNWFSAIFQATNLL